MRVVQLLTQTYGGPADHAVDVAIVLARRGHDSHVVGPMSSRTERARAGGVTWHDLVVGDKRDVRGAWAVARRVATLRPDVLHLQDRRAGWLGRLLGPALRGTRCVYTLHGVADGLSDLVVGNARASRRRRRDRWCYLHAERWLAGWASAAVIVPSHAVATFARQHVRLPADRVHVVTNGVDVELFRPTTTDEPDEPGEPGRELVVLWLGVLGEVKRVALLIDAVGTVPGARLLLAGDGPLRAGLEAYVVRRGLGGRVTFLGRVEDVPALFAGVDVLALTSAAENVPLCVLQAMASGVPVVATAVGGVPEVVRDGIDGLLVLVDDVAATARALGDLRDDPVRRRRMGRAARVRAVSSFSLDRCVDGLEHVYAGGWPCAS